MKIILIALFLVHSQIYAQDFVSLLAEGAPLTVVEFDQLVSPAVNGQTSLNLSTLNAQTGLRSDHHTVTGGLRYQHLNLSSKEPLLRDYFNMQLSLGYRRNFEEGKFWSLMGSFGSSSDQPFKKSRDNTIGLNYVRKFSDRWFGVVNYSNNRAFLNNVPLPGFFWVKEMSRERGLILGFPFIYWMTPIADHWSIRYTGMVPWTHRLKLLYTKFGFFRPYLGLEQAPQSFFRHDREAREDRFFWFERRLGLGLEGGLTRNLRFDLFTGLIYDRRFFETNDFDPEKKSSETLDNSYFASINLRYAF